MTWIDVGAGSQQASDGRFYLAPQRRYLGRKGGKPQTERWVDVFDRQTGKRREAGTVREAKALCAKGTP